jgi:pyrroline-5-carboxylate reductase
MDKDTTIGFIGAGHMTLSLVSGLVESGIKPNQIWVSDRNESKLKALSTQFGVNTESTNQAIAKAVRVLVLSVKPKDMQAVCLELQSLVQERMPLIISLAAGILTSQLARWLGANTAIVRAMPNTPALLRVGATGLYANTRSSEEQKNLAESLMRAVGVTVWVNHEHDMDIITALSGSGPAYFLLMMEWLQKGAEELGLSTNAARLLTLQTSLGAARMAMESDISLEELRKRIATPGGTTEAALKTLEAGGFRTLLKKTLEAAKTRSEEISHLFD